MSFVEDPIGDLPYNPLIWMNYFSLLRIFIMGISIPQLVSSLETIV
jgi:hypothetical protein